MASVAWWNITYPVVGGWLDVTHPEARIRLMESRDPAHMVE